VLDASAVVAFAEREAGAARVLEAIEKGALISAVNWAEVLARLVAIGGDPHQITGGALPGGPTRRVEVVAFDDEQARESARLIRKTRSLGLSLADRAALALAQSRRLPVLTTDRAWRSLRLPITIEVIR
jgi:PIN domain nuclease of toxin-antitoxin system